MLELLQAFVPVADEVGRLQRGEDPECRLFQAFAEQGHYAGRIEPSDTRQGIYAVAPSGRFLASINTRRPAEMAEMLERALALWRELPREQRLLATDLLDDGARVRRHEQRFPEGGAALLVSVRDLPRAEAPADWRAQAWNQDWAWLRAEELRELCAPGADTRPGDSWPAPAALVRRIARAQLLDFVRGQTSAFRDGDVELAELRVTCSERRDERVQLRLEGRSRTSRSGRWRVAGFEPQEVEQTRGVEADWLGSATWDAEAGRLVALELVVRGTRWGGTQFNARQDDLAPAPIGFVLQLVDLAPSERVTPAQFWSYDW